MNRVLKTYPDGSEMTTNMALATAALCIVTGTVGAVAAVKWDSFKERRIMKKYKMGPYAKS